MAKSSDPGLGSSYSKEIKRLVNSDGSYNMIRHGALRGFRDFYKFLIEITWWQFLCLSALYYLAINALFACLYLAVGIDGISGTAKNIPDFFNAFFFSVQTFTSVGYGLMSPTSFATNIIGTFESFAGLMSIALITGLLYGRFSKPTSKLSFSKNILITPFKEETAMMFKMVNKRDSILLNSRVKAILIMDRGGVVDSFNKLYFQLELELDKINFFPLTWTVVHKIDANSPLNGLSVQTLRERNAEILVLVEAFDETHSQMITEKHAYGGNQWLDGVKFDRNFNVNEDGMLELFIDDLDNVIPLDSEEQTR